MKYIMAILVLISGFSLSSPALANQTAHQLGTCMADSLTGKERKLLALWIYFGMSAHPDMSDFTKVSTDTKTATDKQTGELITRLLTEDCPKQTQAVMKLGNSMAMQSAFELVGRVAMQELMTNPNVAQSMASFEKYMDTAKISGLAVND